MLPLPPPAGGRYSAQDLARLAQVAGFPRKALVTAVAVALAESGGNPHARCNNYRTPSGRVTCGPLGPQTISRDACLWQINDRAHPWSRAGNIDDPLTCARAALRISNHGRSWHPWSTYVNGSWLRHVPAARRAVAQLG